MLLTLCVARSAGEIAVLRQDAYIWQRRWAGPVQNAVTANAGLFETWHVLAAEISEGDAVARAAINWRSVTAQGHAAVPVVRIEGRITPVRQVPLLANITSVLASVPQSARVRLEIDHDCATAHLAEYAGFLHAVKQAIGPHTTLTVTVLPTWLAADDFIAVANEVDGLVLQVHAIDDPRLGIFDPGRAAAWVDSLALRTSLPFLVALPAYGARVAAAPGGRLLAVSAEMRAMDGQVGAEMSVSPTSVAAFLADLRRNAPAGLRGVVWFRLPTDDDGRAWSVATLRAVISGHVPPPRIEVVARLADRAGLYNIVVRNDGDIDAALPASVTLPPDCAAADGVGQYGLDGTRLALHGHGLLPAQAAVLAGWMRCAGGVEELRAQD